MDKDEAKFLLQACRPNGEDAYRPAFAEALALAENDPELKTWWEAQQVFDRKISSKLREVPLPEHLRATLLASHKIEQFTPRFHLPYWLAAAAVVAFLCVAGLHPWNRPASLAAIPVSTQEYNASIFHFISHDPTLELIANDHEKVITWLREHSAPTGQLPANMAALSTLGCQRLSVHDHAVSLICFSLSNGEIAHLFIVDEKALVDPPAESPAFGQMGNWATASWSDGAKSYLLITQAGPDMLKHLL